MARMQEGGIGIYAHTKPERPPADWEPLERHLYEVGSLAADLASIFGAQDAARLAGLWHDLGKFDPAFQTYLRDSHAGRMHRSGIDHAIAGAILAARTPHSDCHVCLAFAIAGHHAGLANHSDESDRALDRRITRHFRSTDTLLSRVPSALRNHAPASPPFPLRASAHVPSQCPAAGIRASMFTRMIFSCLVDADRLCTEAFCDPERTAQRGAANRPTVADLRASLDRHLQALAAARAGSPSPADHTRRIVLESCRQAASEPPGLFTLTAPTGSGKTLASMAFALAHAERHGLRRVVYALPFTSVTEQNAQVYRAAFGPLGEAAVLEHHSTYAPRDRDEHHPTEVSRRLAVENWDAPVIVTTNVRLLESLFSDRPSDCRRLHRLARSVIVLDEAQALPVHLLAPTLAALQELVASYGVTIVLCSATIPAVIHRDGFEIGLRNVREIIPDPVGLSASMRRVDVRKHGAWADEQIVDRVMREPQALAIVNTRAHAARLFTMLENRGVPCLHLSAMMCPAHRSDRVAEIKRRLNAKELCRVISTQVVEAGIDIDFPVVLRAMAGLDSIVQAAGRCNREGRLDRGTVEVFETDDIAPSLRTARDDAAQVLADGTDPLALDTIERFFSLHYWTRKGEWDGGKDGPITRMLRPPGDPLAYRSGFRFEDAAKAYRIIDEHTTPVVVPYGPNAPMLCDLLMKSPKLGAHDFRRLQQLTVSMRPFIVERMIASGVCTLTPSGVSLLDVESYHDALGVLVDRGRGPASLMD